MNGTSQTSEQRFRRQWLLPIALLTSVALIVFFGLYAIDHLRSGAPAGTLLERYFTFDSRSLTDALASLAGIIAAVFGIVITVVSIIVQLSADRFAGVTRMFLRDRISLGIVSYYIVACVCGVWLSVSLQQNYVPGVALAAMVVATTGGLVLMAPYFGYVFWFLEPRNIIDRIRRGAERCVEEVVSGDAQAIIESAQTRIVQAMEELTDITNNSVSGKDKIIAGGAVDALRDFALSYLSSKTKMPPSWFSLGEALQKNPDIVAMDPESREGLERQHTWVEWKVLKQYLSIFNEALAHAKDITYLIAINTRYVAEAAGASGDNRAVRLAFRFMNSYIRATLNSRDVRTAYNILNQYRLLVEAMIVQGKERHAREGVEFMIYYGHTSFDINLPFVTETVAYDVASLCQVAHEREVPYADGLLALLLELDRPLRVRSQEKALLGVRKAQVKLAAFFLARGQTDQARRVADDMANEPLERLTVIRQALETVSSKEFWEITDRGTNFEYMPDEHRRCLPEFFSWLGDVPSPKLSDLPPLTIR